MPPSAGFNAPELDDGGLAALASVTALRQLGSNMDRIAVTMDRLSEKVGDVHTDVQVMKEQTKALDDLRAEVKELKGKVSALELRDARQDGAARLLTWMKEFGPWMMTILFFLWGLLGRKA